MDLSIVVPLLNEHESLPVLAERLHKVIGAMGVEYEILFIDDGSTDPSWSVVRKLSADDPRVRGIRFGRNYGKSPALNEGFKEAQGNVVITMDADLQDDPDEVPELYRMIREEGYDLVSGWKKKRYDPLTKTIPTKLFNWTTRRASGVMLHDFNCGLKAYRKEVVKSIEVFGEMHRYIPFIAKKEGFGHIGEKVVKHHPRKFGKTKFGFDRFINGFLDLLTITFVFRFGRKPMHFLVRWERSCSWWVSSARLGSSAKSSGTFTSGTGPHPAFPIKGCSSWPSRPWSSGCSCSPWDSWPSWCAGTAPSATYIA